MPIMEFDGATNTQIGTFTLPGGYNAGSMAMAPGDDRLYVIGALSGNPNRLFVLQDVNAVPEPGSLMLCGLGAAGVAAYAWKKRRKGMKA